jgi:hypothetical protein
MLGSRTPSVIGREPGKLTLSGRKETRDGRKHPRLIGSCEDHHACTAGWRAGSGAGADQRRAAASGQPARAAAERSQHLRRLARGDLPRPTLGAPRQLHLPGGRHRTEVRRGAGREGDRRRARPGALRLVRLDGRAALFLEAAPERGRRGPGGQPAGSGRAARGDPTGPPEAARGGRRVRLDGRGVHLGWVAGHLPRDGPSLPGHGREPAWAGRGRCGARLRRRVGRLRGAVAGRGAPPGRAHPGGRGKSPRG